MLHLATLGECGAIFNLDGHAQIKKCSHVSGVLHASVVSLAWPLHKRMTRTFVWLKKEAAAAASGFFPRLGFAVTKNHLGYLHIVRWAPLASKVFHHK